MDRRWRPRAAIPALRACGAWPASRARRVSTRPWGFAAGWGGVVLMACGIQPPPPADTLPAAQAGAFAPPASGEPGHEDPDPSLTVERAEWHRGVLDPGVTWGTRTDSVSSEWTVTLRNTSGHPYHTIRYQVDYRTAAGTLLHSRTGTLGGSVGPGATKVFVIPDGFVEPAVAEASFRVTGARPESR